MLLLAVGGLGVGKAVAPDLVPVSALTIPVIVGGWRLSVRSYVLLAVAVSLALAYELVNSPFARSYIAAGVVVVVMVLMYRYLTQRQEWGVRASTGMPILLDVRRRVRALGEPPALAEGWVMARALRSARDEPFRGDFTLARADGSRVQAMVVDVSGHGADVASRAMQVAGAFGGLVDVIACEDLLEACNQYLCRQGWAREYATAIHVVIDQQTGTTRVRSAGHPQARVRRSDGSWMIVTSQGPVLGLVPGTVYEPVEVTLQPGDTLVMVSDGALDDESANPWSSVERTVEDWLMRGAPPGSAAVPDDVVPSLDDQTILSVRRG